jgi:hypothetical protein
MRLIDRVMYYCSGPKLKVTQIERLADPWPMRPVRFEPCPVYVSGPLMD